MNIVILIAVLWMHGNPQPQVHFFQAQSMEECQSTVLDLRQRVVHEASVQGSRFECVELAGATNS